MSFTGELWGRTPPLEDPMPKPPEVSTTDLVIRQTKIIHELRIELEALKKFTACTRSHPHEAMAQDCELRTEIARLTNELARLRAAPAVGILDRAHGGEKVANLMRLAETADKAVASMTVPAPEAGSESKIVIDVGPGGSGGGPAEAAHAPAQERCSTCGYLTSEREHLGCLRRAVKDLDIVTGGPYDAQEVATDPNGWCQYVAGVVFCWLQMQKELPPEDQCVAAIAGIIERRLWVYKPAQEVGTTTDAIHAGLWRHAVRKGVVTVHTECMDDSNPGTKCSWIQGHDKAADVSNEAAALCAKRASDA